MLAILTITYMLGLLLIWHWWPDEIRPFEVRFVNPELSKELLLVSSIALVWAVFPTVVGFRSAFKTSSESEGKLAKIIRVIKAVWVR